MTLPRVRILQVGDLHLPTAAKTAPFVDNKDKAFSIELRNVISRQPLKVVFRKIYELLEEGMADAILFMGDLTDYGGLEGYKAGVSYITNALQLGRGRRFESIVTGIVPGNHDINRNLAKESLIAKFAPLSATLSEAGIDALPVQQSNVKAISIDGARCEIVMMNSCWGCGAVEYIPKEFRISIGNAIEKALTDGGTDVFKAYYDRQFDTPAFSDKSIEELLDLTTKLPSDSLIVIAAHHNLLPQRQTRIAPYTELINSGALRASLMEAGRPILYLHGHIHTAPIEVLSVPRGDSLVCISAPAAEISFNIIEIVYTREGLPLVGHVEPYIFDQSGKLRRSSRVSFPLIGSRRRSLDAGLYEIYAHVIKVRQCYWGDLVVGIGSKLTVDSEERLQECVELLIADQTITVENYSSRRESWILEARI